MISTSVFELLVVLGCCITSVQVCPIECKCYRHKFLRVLCQSSNLTKVPDGIPGDAYLLDLQDNNIQHIDPGSFAGLNNLVRLDLSGSNVMNISVGSFSGLSNLEILAMNYNKIVSLEEDVFEPLINLDLLSLDNNMIERIHLNAFRGLQRLRDLTLRGNNLLSIDGNIFRATPNLEKIDLSENSIVSYNNKGVPNNTDIRILNLRENNIKTIHPDAFSKFHSLEELDLSFNEITELEDDLFLGTSNLRKLFLNDNRITRLMRSVFSGLKNLQLLHLERNFIEVIQDGTFDDLLDLKTLILYENQLKDISACLFYGLQNVATISVYDNNIASIADEAFASCLSLNELIINENKLTIIDHKTLSSLPSLKYLDVSNNLISFIHPQAFQRMSSLSQLKILGSRIDCSCQQLVPILLEKADNIYVTCYDFTDQHSYHHTIPSIVRNATEDWSQFSHLPVVPSSNSGVALMKKRKCASCENGGYPWCIKHISQSTLDNCVTFRVTKTSPHTLFLNSTISGCPLLTRTVVNDTSKDPRVCPTPPVKKKESSAKLRASNEVVLLATLVPLAGFIFVLGIIFCWCKVTGGKSEYSNQGTSEDMDLRNPESIERFAARYRITSDNTAETTQEDHPVVIGETIQEDIVQIISQQNTTDDNDNQDENASGDIVQINSKEINQYCTEVRDQKLPKDSD